jgi:predicted amidophosphoribosyltransferase
MLLCEYSPMNAPAHHCLNCDAPLVPNQAYCSACGQKADTHRLSMHDIGHAMVHVFTHADHSVFALVRDLAFKPGRVAREYLDGKRRK